MDFDSITVEASLPTPASEPSSIPVLAFPASRILGTLNFSKTTKITQKMIMNMGHLAHLTDMRVSRLDIFIPWMLESAICVTHNNLHISNDSLNTRFEAWKSILRETYKVTNLKCEVAYLRKHAEYQKSPYFMSFLKVPDYINAHMVLKIPLATTRYIHRDEAPLNNLDAEMDKEHMKIRDKTMYRKIARSWRDICKTSNPHIADIDMPGSVWRNMSL